MKATTIKLDGELLRDLEHAKPRDESVTEFVRGTLRRALNQQKLRDSAVAYQALQAGQPDEVAWLKEWESAPLATAPLRAASRRSRA